MVADLKAVEACGSCHVMDHFVTDLLDSASVTLAARHFRADSMPAAACCSCHTGYRPFGAVGAKKDGLVADVITCFMCHGEPHARHAVPDTTTEPTH